MYNVVGVSTVARWSFVYWVLHDFAYLASE